MSAAGIIVIVFLAAVIAVLAVAGSAEYRRRKLRESFGSEYDRITSEQGSRRAADRELARRRRLRATMSLRPLGPVDHEYYTTNWEHVQGGFLDAPVVSLDAAEQLIHQLLDARGYRGDNRDDVLALVSVDHGRKLAAYRGARSVRDQAERQPGSVSTEAMRVALKQYHEFYGEVLSAAVAAAPARRVQESEV